MGDPGEQQLLKSAAFRYGVSESTGIAYVQSVSVVGEDESEPAAAVDLVDGTVSLTFALGNVELSGMAHGVLGMCCLGRSWALALVTEVLKVGTLEGSVIYRVTKTDVVTVQQSSAGGDSDTLEREKRLLGLLKEALSPSGAGRGLYYSPSLDLTLNTQQRQSLSEKGRPTVADPGHHFCWNGHLSRPFFEAGAGSFIPRVIHGSVQYLEGLDWCNGPKHTMGSVCIISRRSVMRAGCRHWRRGADPQGHCSNFVETEQVMEFYSQLQHSEQTVAAFVQVRGSVPILWMQPPNLEPLPPVTIGPEDVGREALQKHFHRLRKTYGPVAVLSLLSVVRHEGLLQRAFTAAMAGTHTSGEDHLRVTHFDVHKECGGVLNSGFREKLLPKVEPLLTSHGIFYRTASGVQSLQNGVVRTNCFDSLDRTNMAQQVLAARALEMALIRAGLMLARPGLHLDLAHRVEECALRCKWADNGDELALQYAGSGAMKSSYTRTGAVTLTSFAEDIAKVTARFFINAFADGEKQDSLDLFLGHAEVAQQKGSVRAARQPSPAAVGSLLLCGLGSFLYGLARLRVLPILGGGVLLGGLLACRSLLVDRPALLPQAHRPW